MSKKKPTADDHIDFMDYLDKGDAYKDYTDYVYQQSDGEVIVERSYYLRLPGEPVFVVCALQVENIQLADLTPAALAQVLLLSEKLRETGQTHCKFYWDEDKINHKVTLKVQGEES